MKQTNYQLVVVGAGSGGLVAAESAKLGVKVALVEAKDRLGGECLWDGCVPSKALIHAARLAWQASHSQRFGVQAQPKIDFAAVMEHVNASIHFIEEHHDNDAFYQGLGVEVLHGDTEFIDSHTLRVGGTQISGKRFIVATGSSPFIPSIDGLQDATYLTNESIFSLETLPTSLTVIGGGPIGCELGQAFAMLGSKVTILQSAERLLPRDEHEASETLLKSMHAMGIRVELNAKIAKVAKQGKATAVHFTTTDGTPVILETEKLLVATGRKPNIPEGLERIGIQTTPRGISVDRGLRTNLRHIFAVGDCNGGLQFTHTAAEQAVIASRNALLGTSKKFDGTYTPWVTFTTPEIAHLGPTKEELTARSHLYKTQRSNFNEIDKAITEDEAGYIEVLTDTKDHVLAATIVGANAAELLGTIVLLRNLNLPITKIAGLTQAYPTYNLGLQRLGAAETLKKLTESIAGPLFKIFLRLKFGK